MYLPFKCYVLPTDYGNKRINWFRFDISVSRVVLLSKLCVTSEKGVLVVCSSIKCEVLTQDGHEKKWKNLKTNSVITCTIKSVLYKHCINITPPQPSPFHRMHPLTFLDSSGFRYYLWFHLLFAQQFILILLQAENDGTDRPAKRGKITLSSGVGGRVVLPIIRGRLRPKWVLFQASGVWNDSDFKSLGIWKGWEICHLGGFK